MLLLKQAFQSLFSLVFPNVCTSCDQELVDGEKEICITCWNSLAETNFETYDNNPIAKALHGRFYFTKAAGIFYFHKDSSIQKMLHALKYQENADLGLLLGEKMASRLMTSNWLHQQEVIVPVPLSEKRLKQRGYNQSVMLAKGIQQVFPIAINETSLIRNRHTESQTKKNIQERRINVEGAFSVTHAHHLKHKRVVLLDDVFTTGATLEACARELLKVEGLQLSILTMVYAVD